MALLALSMVSALAVGGVFIARSVAASARLSERGEELQSPVERALIGAVAAWDSAGRAAQPVGAAAELTTEPEAGGVKIWITRLNQDVYWLVAESGAGDRPRLHRRLGLLVTVASGSPNLALGRAWTELD